jgi:hypothetical protein
MRTGAAVGRQLERLLHRLQLEAHPRGRLATIEESLARNR